MRVVILQTNYLPWKGYFDLIHDADIFVYYDEVQYTNRDWRNRNKIYSKNGLHWLSIPVSKDSKYKRISEVEMSDHRWQKKHYTSISKSYANAPSFEEVKELLDNVYLANTWYSLSKLNKYLIEEISTKIGCKTVFKDASSLDLRGDRVERLIHILTQVNAREYISGPSARDYLAGSEHLFADNNIKLTYKEYAGYPEYKQMREPFEHAVSIIDLIVNVGFERTPFYIWGWRASSNETPINTRLTSTHA